MKKLFLTLQIRLEVVRFSMRQWYRPKFHFQTGAIRSLGEINISVFYLYDETR